MYKPRLFQILRILIVVGALLGSYFLMKLTILFLYPLLLAVIISFVIDPFVSFFEKRLKFPRFVATIIVIIVMFLIIIGTLLLVITEVFQGTAYLADKVPAQFQVFIHFAEEILNTKVLPLYHKVISFFHTLDPSQQITISENIKHFTNQIASTGADLLQNFLLKIPVVLSFLPNSITVFMFTVLATILITNDLSRLKQAVKKVTPSSARSSTKHIFQHIKKAFSGFIKAQLMLVFITASIIFIGLLFLGVDHVLTIVLLAMVLDLIPFIGTGVIFIPWIIYLFITANYQMTISLTILYMIIIISRQILEPKILSSNMGMHPLVALIGLFVGFQLWGLLGILIAPVMLVLLNALYQAGVMKQIGLFIKG